MTVALSDAQNALRAYADSVQSDVAAYNRAASDAQDVLNLPSQAAALQRAVQRHLSSIASVNNGNSELCRTALEMFGDTLGAQSGLSLQQYIDLLFKYMGDNSLEVKSRGVSYGSATDNGGNTGNQTLSVCGTSRYNQVIESTTIETLTFEMTSPTSGQRNTGQERYSVKGDGRGSRSPLDGVGTGVSLNGDTPFYTAIEPGISGIIGRGKNGSFDNAFGSGTTDKIPFWTIPSGDGNIARDTDTADIARDRGTVPQASLVITGNCVIQFNFREQGISLSSLAPYIFGLRYKASVNNVCNLDVRLGTDTGTYSVDVNSGALSTTYVNLVSDPDVNDAWREVFDTDGNPILEIEVSSYNTGTLHIDDPFVAEMTNIGGRWCAIVSGLTKPIIGDSHTHQTQLTDNTAGSVALKTGASGSVNTIFAGDVDLLKGTPVAFDTSLTVTADNIVSFINDEKNRTYPNYTASNSSGTISVFQEIPAEGTVNLSATATTITVSNVDISGASLGTIQDSLVRVTGRDIPHASSATSGWGDT